MQKVFHKKLIAIFSVCLALIVGFVSAIILCAQALSVPVPVAAQNTELKIVVDAGHGGVDGGVVGKNGTKESDLNLAVSLQLKGLLEEAGFEVTLTRKTSSGLYGMPTKGFKKRDMLKRKEIIENAAPDLVLSIHQNFYPASSARGAQVFYNAKNARSQTLAQCLQTQLNDEYQKQGVKSRVEKSGEYYILQCTDAPTVIVECGFLSNAKDEALLKSDDFKRKLCSSVVAGVLQYLQAQGAAGFA